MSRIALLLMIILVGCGQVDSQAEISTRRREATSTASAPPELVGTEWVLTSLKGHSLLEDSNITLNFADKITGFAGCNWYEAEYTATMESVEIPEISRTARDCSTPERILQQEAAYLEALYTATAYRIVDARLEIVNEASETTLVFSMKE